MPLRKLVSFVTYSLSIALDSWRTLDAPLQSKDDVDSDTSKIIRPTLIPRRYIARHSIDEPLTRCTLSVWAKAEVNSKAGDISLAFDDVDLKV